MRVECVRQALDFRLRGKAVSISREPWAAREKVAKKYPQWYGRIAEVNSMISISWLARISVLSLLFLSSYAAAQVAPVISNVPPNNCTVDCHDVTSPGV